MARASSKERPDAQQRLLSDDDGGACQLKAGVVYARIVRSANRKPRAFVPVNECYIVAITRYLYCGLGAAVRAYVARRAEADCPPSP